MSQTFRLICALNRPTKNALQPYPEGRVQRIHLISQARLDLSELAPTREVLAESLLCDDRLPEQVRCVSSESTIGRTNHRQSIRLQQPETGTPVGCRGIIGPFPPPSLDKSNRVNFYEIVPTNVEHSTRPWACQNSRRSACTTILANIPSGNCADWKMLGLHRRARGRTNSMRGGYVLIGVLSEFLRAAILPASSSISGSWSRWPLR